MENVVYYLSSAALVAAGVVVAAHVGSYLVYVALCLASYVKETWAETIPQHELWLERVGERLEAFVDRITPGQ